MSTLKKLNSVWDYALKDFIEYYPHLSEQIVEWYPSGQMEIVIKLASGNKVLFSWLDKTLGISDKPTIIELYNHDEYNQEYLDEISWRKEFAYKLNKKMRNFGISQDGLAERTGISRVMLSKYVNGKATPSFYRIEQIARELKCSVSELGNIR